jgi:transposase
MEVSLRHTKRLLAGYRKEGAKALAHGNRGRLPCNVIDVIIRERVVELARVKYTGFNQQHFSEKLREQEGIPLSRSSVRRILLEQGIASPRKRRAPKHRSRRERYPQKGMLLQTDGSPHDWLEGRGPKLCLIGAIDDATNEVPYAFLQPQETTSGYIRMLRSVTSTHGRPLALYHDRHSIFEETEDKMPSGRTTGREKSPNPISPNFGGTGDQLNLSEITSGKRTNREIMGDLSGSPG